MDGKELLCRITDFIKLKTKRVANTMNINAVHMLKSVTNAICDSFIITTDDGKVIVIDGGYRTETKYFLEYLRQVTGSKKPHIDAWFLSHPHNDHCEVFLNIAENYSDKVEIKKICLSFAPVEFYADKNSSAERIVRKYNQLKPAFAKKECILNNGDILNIGSAEITVLNAFDPKLESCNDTSLVFRMVLGGKSIMFTGDIGICAGERILQSVKDSSLLKSDICKMPHHGQDGCGKAFYEAVAPEICLWPTPSWIWNNRNGNLQTPEVKQWMQDIGVKKHYVSKDGTAVIYLR